jgi:NAD(P)-dependent dehydrogenase (short-subunit alcohol dehydrogenase family)
MEQHQPSQQQPPQHQDRQPGIESTMTPRPRAEDQAYRGSGKLQGQVALITGGDSGIGRAVAILFAKESADVGREPFCQDVVQQTVAALGQLDILVNNAAEQHPQDSLAKITAEQLARTFRTNIFSYFYMSKAALPHLHAGSAIINTTSVTAYRGSPHLLDYSATKGAIVAFTRSLALALVDQGIRVNGVAPGPIWTPLIPSTFAEDRVESFGADAPMQRAGQPEEVAPSYVFLASDDASYMAGQILHPNGGEVVNG